MTTTTSQRRLIAIAGHDSHVDIAAPVESTVGQALASVGIQMDPTRHALVTRTGSEISGDSRVLDLADGTLLTLVDLRAPTVQKTGRRSSRPQPPRHEYYSAWWLIGTAGVVLAATAMLNLANGLDLFTPTQRLVVAAALGLGAIISAVAWTHRTPGHRLGEAITVIAPVALAFAAGVFAVPPVASAAHLGVTVGLLAAALLCAVTTVTSNGRELRGVASTATVITLILAGIWGGALLLGWGIAAAAAVSIGIVAPGLRALPTTLLNLAEGYSINYQHFMSNRWTVRGAVPENPGVVTLDRISPHVWESSARLAAGTVLLSVIAPVMAPFMVGGLASGNTLVAVGTAATLTATVLVLMLLPRHGSAGPLRWLPRAAGALVMLEVVIAIGFAAGSLAVGAFAAGGLIVGVGTLALVVPMGRGFRSLAWSRLGDIIEGMAVVFAMPAAMLAANVFEELREMMAG